MFALFVPSSDKPVPFSGFSACRMMRMRPPAGPAGVACPQLVKAPARRKARVATKGLRQFSSVVVLIGEWEID